MLTSSLPSAGYDWTVEAIKALPRHDASWRCFGGLPAHMELGSYQVFLGSGVYALMVSPRSG